MKKSRFTEEQIVFALKQAELGTTRQTLYRRLSPAGKLRPDGKKMLNRG